MANQSAAALGLKRLRERAGLSVRELADAIGRPASSYAFYEDKYRKPFLPMDLIRELMPVLANRGIGADDLLQLAGVARGGAVTAPPDIAVAESLSRLGEGADYAEAPIRILELDVRAMAGGGFNHELQESEDIVARWELPQDLLRSQTTAPAASLRIIRVYGDSMVPDFNPGERVLVDTLDRNPSPPGVFVLWDGFGLVIKRLEIVPYTQPATVRLLSRNGTYSNYERPLSDVHVNGRVIGKWLWT